MPTVPFVADSHEVSIEHTLLFTSLSTAQSPAIATITDDFPATFVRAPNGKYLFFATGLDPMMKWDGVQDAADTVGVEAPTTAVTMDQKDYGDIVGVYTAYTRFIDEDGNPSNLSPVSDTLTVNKRCAKILYSDVPTPTEDKVVRRQILRNTAGQALVYYVDIDTTDLGSTDFESTKTDEDLVLEEAAALFDSEGNSIANRFGIPRTDRPYIANYLNRIFAAGTVTYQQGHVEVTFGSATVTGVGTGWTDALKNRFFYVIGHDRPYEVESVASTTSLTLTSQYLGPTETLAVYAIRTPPGERLQISWSEAGFDDAWNSLASISLEATDDDITGLMVANSNLYVLLRRRMFQFAFQRDPALDGNIFPGIWRGCVNNRCWVHTESGTFILDERGVYAFDGSGATEVSSGVQDLFREPRPDAEFAINWDASKWFHAVHQRNESVIRWFVALSGDYLPRHALCFNYQLQSWWIEEYPYNIGASCVMDREGVFTVLAGHARKVLTFSGTLDGPDPSAGSVRGTVTAASTASISDTAAVFASSGIVGNPVSIVDGKGKGQQRLVSAISGTTITVTQPWLDKPDTTSTYQLGAVPWRWRSGWLQFADEDGREMKRRAILTFDPVDHDNELDMRIYMDHAKTPEQFAKFPPTGGDKSGYEVAESESDIEIDLTFASGYVPVVVDDGSENRVREGSFVSVELEGHSAQDPVRVHYLRLEGAAQSNA